VVVVHRFSAGPQQIEVDMLNAQVAPLIVFLITACARNLHCTVDLTAGNDHSLGGGRTDLTIAAGGGLE
jgi:hypothetical protein